MTMRSELLRSIVVTALLCFPSLAAAQGMFIRPLGNEGYEPYEEWTIVNYIDLDPSSGVLDWNGGNYTYDGHGGIDFTLANFAKMDAGVPIYAAADGNVTIAQDGYFDRCTPEVVPACNGNEANYVRIQHAGGIETRYFHMRKGSVAVSVGDHVTQGQIIGYVGSSGNSSDAHLHFDVYVDGTRIESFLDNNETAMNEPEFFWGPNPLDYIPYPTDRPGSLDSGVTDHNPSTPELRERPDEFAVFPLTDSNDPNYWIQLHGIDGADWNWIRYEWLSPDGTHDVTHTDSIGSIRYGWREDAISLPDAAAASDSYFGEWEVVATLRENLIGGNVLEVGRVNFTTVIPGDINLDNEVDMSDVLAFVNGWLYQQAQGDLTSWGKGDLNQDGKTTLEDAYLLHEALLEFGSSTAALEALGAAVPEPASFALLFFALLFTASFRRRK